MILDTKQYAQTRPPHCKPANKHSCDTLIGEYLCVYRNLKCNISIG